jgi:hypothetical protein
MQLIPLIPLQHHARLLDRRDRKEKIMTSRIVSMLIICLSAMWAAAPAKCADPVPPPNYPFHDSPPNTLKRHPALSVALGPLIVKLGKTNLKEVQKMIGSGEIHEKGDAAENTLWLCYSSFDKENSWRIWLMSNGEMDAPEGRIYGIVAKFLPGSESKPSCPTLPIKFSSVLLNN